MSSRLALRGGLLAIQVTGHLMTGRSLSQLSPETRANVLRRLASLGPDASAALEGLKAVVLMANGADTYATELFARAREHEPARPDAVLNVISSIDSPSVVTADAVVVGSGAGGAMVARTLAQAGLDTVVVEEGRRWTVDEFRSRHPIDRFAGLYRGAGATVALGRPAIVMPMGRAVGGSTVVNSGTCYRPPLTVQRHWRDEYGLGLADPAQLSGYLDEVERTLQVAPVPLEIMGRNGTLLLVGAEALGWRAAPIPATHRGVTPAASARSAVRAMPSSECISTRCRRPAWPERGF
ncbi:FAD binding domain protein [Mycobacterium xenopi 4042]|uniref:FAD binding domain protein n=1 Tax=Mycobacterium xenopi 4042 TaxID=1299334 RepID=X8DN84_MYCXE|nr:FAD binding domain protein [Mycobacterium xenopi 4042]